MNASKSFEHSHLSGRLINNNVVTNTVIIDTTIIMNKPIALDCCFCEAFAGRPVLLYSTY